MAPLLSMFLVAAPGNVGAIIACDYQKSPTLYEVRNYSSLHEESALLSAMRSACCSTWDSNRSPIDWAMSTSENRCGDMKERTSFPDRIELEPASVIRQVHDAINRATGP